MLKEIVLAFGLWVLTSSVSAQNVFDLRGSEASAALTEYAAAIQQDQNNVEALKNAGIILHQVNRTHPDKQQVETAERYLSLAHKLRPDDHETAGWLGSVITMKALFESDPGKQTFFVKSGTRMIDKAVQQAPDNLVLRLTRAYNGLELPVFLRRTKFAVEDFKYYLTQCADRSCSENQLADARDKLRLAEQIVADNH